MICAYPHLGKRLALVNPKEVCTNNYIRKQSSLTYRQRDCQKQTFQFSHTFCANRKCAKNRSREANLRFSSPEYPHLSLSGAQGAPHGSDLILQCCDCRSCGVHPQRHQSIPARSRKTCLRCAIWDWRKSQKAPTVLSAPIQKFLGGLEPFFQEGFQEKVLYPAFLQESGALSFRGCKIG